MENIIDTLFGNTLFSNIYFTDENPAKIETIDISKINNEIKEVKKTQVFNLLKYEISNSGLISLNIRENIKSNLLIKLNFSQTNNLKYFNLGFIKNLFNKRNVNTLLNTFEGKDWVITSDNIISELSKSERFESQQGYGDIRLIGKIDNTLIYKIKDIENIIYIGNNGSVTTVFNKNISDINNGVNIEYLLEVSDDIKKIIVY